MKRQFWGAVLIVLGVMALLQALNLFDFRLEFWPVVATVGGLAILWSSFKKTSWIGLALGLWVTAMGVFSILDNFPGLTPVTGADIARGGWPLLLVASGVSMIFGKSSMRFVYKADWKGRGSHKNAVGGMRIGQSGPWVLDGDLNLEQGVGDMRVDLTTAQITDGVHHIKVQAGIGDVVVRVPDNVNVMAVGKVGMGDLEVLTERRSGIGPNAEARVVVPDSPVELVIHAQLGLGDLNIVQRPAIKVIS